MGEWGCVLRPWQHREINYVGVSAKTGRPLARCPLPFLASHARRRAPAVALALSPNRFTPLPPP